MAAGKIDRAFPIGIAGTHPASRVQRDTLDRECEFWNRDAPCGRDLAAVNLGKSPRRHGEVGRCDLKRRAVARKPFAGAVMVAVGLAHPVQHQLFAGVQMQRQPLPAALIRRERLAAPLAVQPGLPGDLGRLVVEGDAARHSKIRLAVIIRSEEHTSELQSPDHLVCRLLLEKKKKNFYTQYTKSLDY